MFRPPMMAIVRLYTLKLVNCYSMQILVQFDVEISNTITFIGFRVSNNNTVGIQSVELVVCSGLVSRVLLGFLMGVNVMVLWCSRSRQQIIFAYRSSLQTLV
jgi:hypothetical protein